MIIAEDVEGEALTTLVVNKLRGMLNVCAVKAPGFGDRRKAMLGDIAILTGGTIISEDLGMKLENLTLEQLGRPRRSRSTRTRRRSSRAPARRPTSRAASISSATQIETTDSDYDREKYQERLAKLSGGVAVVSVGASTEAEMKQKKARVEDALHATRAAAEEGILPGGGVALLRCREAVEKARAGARGDEKIGVDIVARRARQADRADRRQLRRRRLGGRRRSGEKPTNTGYDANAGKYVDMFKAGIIDPLKVVRTALENAASIAGLMLTTETLVTDLKKEDKKSAGSEGSVR